MSTQEQVAVDGGIAEDNLAGLDELAEFETGHHTAEPDRRWGLRALIAVGIVIALVAAVVITWTITDRNRRAAAAEAYLSDIAVAEDQEANSAAQLQASYDTLAEQLREAIATGQQVVDVSVGEVSDENGRVTLVDAITSATQLVPEGGQLTFQEQEVRVTADRPLHDDPEYPARTFVVAIDTIPSLTDMEAALSWLQVATSTVQSDHLAWATTHLEGAIETGRTLQTEAAEQVSNSDKPLLTTLAEALDAADAALAAGGEDPEMLIAQLTAVTSASDLVSEAQQKWIGRQQEAAAQAESDAREQAAAQAAAQQQDDDDDGGGPALGPRQVAAIVNQYANPSGPCTEVGRFEGGAGTNWAGEAASWSQRTPNVSFEVSGNRNHVTVVVSTCPAD